MKKLLGSYNLDVCLANLPEVENAKKATKLVSKVPVENHNDLTLKSLQ